MPQINIRPAVAADIPLLVELDHDYVTDYVWQMDVQRPEEGQINIGFRQVRLPRSARVEYPRPVRALRENWQSRSGLLVARLQDQVVGYISLSKEIAPLTTWVTDLAIMRRVRRQGIAGALIFAAQEWAQASNTHRLVLDMQPKNYPAICLALKLGFDLCGYNDQIGERRVGKECRL